MPLILWPLPSLQSFVDFHPYSAVITLFISDKNSLGLINHFIYIFNSYISIYVTNALLSVPWQSTFWDIEYLITKQPLNQYWYLKYYCTLIFLYLLIYIYYNCIEYFYTYVYSIPVTIVVNIIVCFVLWLLYSCFIFFRHSQPNDQRKRSWTKVIKIFTKAVKNIYFCSYLKTDQMFIIYKIVIFDYYVSKILYLLQKLMCLHIKILVVVVFQGTEFYNQGLRWKRTILTN